MTEPTWTAVCVLCAARGRQTRLKAGHCCAACATRLGDDLASIGCNGDLAAVSERTAPTGQSSTGYESKPPVDLDGLAPYLVGVRLNPGEDPPLVRTVAEILGEWERLVREERGLIAYGLATSHHTGIDEGVLAAQASRQSLALLRSHLEWLTADAGFPLEDFAYEIRRCAARMQALVSAGTSDRMVSCPTLVATDDDTDLTACGQRLTVRTWAALDEDVHGQRDRTIGEDITCRRCGVTRTPEQLLHAAGKEDTWADPEALAQWFGVGKSTLRRWAGQGKVRRQHGLYSWSDVSETIEAARRGA